MKKRLIEQDEKQSKNFKDLKSKETLINKLKQEEEATPEAPKGPTEVELLAEIRDTLKQR